MSSSTRNSSSDAIPGNLDFVKALGVGIKNATGVELAADHANTIAASLRGGESSLTTPLEETLTDGHTASLLPSIVAACWQYNINLCLLYAREPCAYFSFDESFATIQLTFISYRWLTVADAYQRTGTHRLDDSVAIDAAFARVHADNKRRKAEAIDAQIALQLQRELDSGRNCVEVGDRLRTEDDMRRLEDERRRLEDERRRLEDERRRIEDARHAEEIALNDAMVAMQLQCMYDVELACQLQREINDMPLIA